MKKVKCTSSVDPGEAAHFEPPHQDQLCLSYSISILHMIQLLIIIIEIFADVKSVCFLAEQNRTLLI